MLRGPLPGCSSWAVWHEQSKSPNPTISLLPTGKILKKNMWKNFLQNDFCINCSHHSWPVRIEPVRIPKISKVPIPPQLEAFGRLMGGFATVADPGAHRCCSLPFVLPKFWSPNLFNCHTIITQQIGTRTARKRIACSLGGIRVQGHLSSL